MNPITSLSVASSLNQNLGSNLIFQSRDQMIDTGASQPVNLLGQKRVYIEIESSDDEEVAASEKRARLLIEPHKQILPQKKWAKRNVKRLPYSDLEVAKIQDLIAYAELKDCSSISVQKRPDGLSIYFNNSLKYNRADPYKGFTGRGIVKYNNAENKQRYYAGFFLNGESDGVALVSHFPFKKSIKCLAQADSIILQLDQNHAFVKRIVE